LYFCTSKASELSTWSQQAQAAARHRRAGSGKRRHTQKKQKKQHAAGGRYAEAEAEASFFILSSSHYYNQYIFNDHCSHASLDILQLSLTSSGPFFWGGGRQAMREISRLHKLTHVAWVCVCAAHRGLNVFLPPTPGTGSPDCHRRESRSLSAARAKKRKKMHAIKHRAYSAE